MSDTATATQVVQRLGKHVRKRLDEALDLLTAQGRCAVDGDVVSVPRA